MDEYETELMLFLCAPELERWLQRSLSGHNVLFSVHLLDDISFSLFLNFFDCRSLIVVQRLEWGNLNRSPLIFRKGAWKERVSSPPPYKQPFLIRRIDPLEPQPCTGENFMDFAAHVEVKQLTSES